MITNRTEPFILLIGDIACFLVSLWLALYLRYFGIPTEALFNTHFAPFALLSIAWFIVFFIAGLYDKHTEILKSRLPSRILNAQIANSFIAVLFFYLIPYFVITPKVILFIYIVVSSLLIMLWRIAGYAALAPRKKQKALLIGSGREIEELTHEVNSNSRYGLTFVSSIDLNEKPEIDFKLDILDKVYEDGVSVVVIDMRNQKIEPMLPHLYNLIFSGIFFIDKYKIYEDTFERVPFSLLRYSWFLENVSASKKEIYDFLKRTVDLVFSFIFAVISLIFYPFVLLAIKLEDGGPVFIVQERIGEGGKKINLLKFRSMKSNDRGVWVVEQDNRITKTGKFLRKTRIDELPQLWNVVKGDISLIGPRPDIYDLGMQLAEEIPYYTIRSIIKPGLSGWAQIKQDLPPQSLEETRLRLAYDLYYVKNRSFFLDIQIILQTIKTLLSRSGK